MYDRRIFGSLQVPANHWVQRVEVEPAVEELMLDASRTTFDRPPLHLHSCSCFRSPTSFPSMYLFRSPLATWGAALRGTACPLRILKFSTKTSVSLSADACLPRDGLFRLSFILLLAATKIKIRRIPRAMAEPRSMWLNGCEKSGDEAASVGLPVIGVV